MDTSEHVILIVDDEAAIRDMVAAAVRLAGYTCLEAATTHEAHTIIIDYQPDLVLLDWMLPRTSGIEFCRRLKQEQLTAELPIIMLTARTDEDNKVQGLDAGADDYITKPFSPRELLARIKAILRRTTTKSNNDIIKANGIELDPASQRVRCNENPINLGPTEYRLLLFLMSHQERVYSRAQLLDHVWGGNVYIEDRTVDVHIRRLRKALGPSHQKLIQTVRGSGYRFSTQSE